MLFSLGYFCYRRLCYIFFFKQKTAYEMRISDWSSDVCSSDLPFTLQWAGELSSVRAHLNAAGWQAPVSLGPGQVLHWLTSSATIAELPVMPQVNGGEHPALVRRLPINDHQQYFLQIGRAHV